MSEETTQGSVIPPGPADLSHLKEALPKNPRTKEQHQKNKNWNKEKQEAVAEISTYPGKYDLDKLKHWIKLDIDRPNWVPLAEWKAARDGLGITEGAMCQLAAILMKEDDIARSVGCEVGYVRKVLGTLAAKDEIKKLQDRLWSGSVKNSITHIVPVAIKTLHELMTDPKSKPAVRAAAAIHFLDRGMGKPIQQVEINDNLVRMIYEKLDGETGKVIDLGAQPRDVPALTKDITVDKVEEPAADPVDQWAKENL